MFPAASVIVHVTVVIPSGNTAGASLDIEVEGQLSSTIGDPIFTEVEEQKPGSADAVTSTGQVIEGGSISITVTNCMHVAILPESSVTVQVTMVSPIGNMAGASLATEATPQLSFEGGVSNPGFAAEHISTSVSRVISAKQVTTGA